MLQLETLFSQDNVPCTRQEYGLYLLCKIIPLGEAQSISRLPLNLALVIDNSGSMYGDDKRIHLALEAAIQAVNLLSPTDFVSVIAFSDSERVVQQALPASNRDQIIRSIQSILKMPSGGTNIPAGMRAGSAELLRNLSKDRLNRVLLLTDGNTEHEDQCPGIVSREAEKGISFSTFGVGFDWNEKLLSLIAERSGGKWHYIDSPQKIGQAFQQELGVMMNSVFSNVRLGLKFFQNDVLREAKIVSPEVKEVRIDGDPISRNYQITLGAMERNRQINLLVNLALIGRAPGRYNIASISVQYDLSGQPNQSTKPESLAVNFVTDNNLVYNNGEVLRWVDDAQIDKMVRKATELAASGEKQKATVLLQNAGSLSDKRGDSRKTTLINNALTELGAQGSISRKTVIEAQNEARKTKLMPDDN
ncbi:MAG: VWA domain-containing protein [Chloroflexi bacterium]|uniref:VWA domain-containing protein n=1 Tax=Candidatus Chlorohelix allophototropha TaxID=3003348 RepID=A0A8T7M587_9CHLR|nr:VWA domain-containing protein [Chloroflexota bacterium]WJW69074.1 VWA domain-containing protein [Chloroflexota bacterium L227-S17]